MAIGGGGMSSCQPTKWTCQPPPPPWPYDLILNLSPVTSQFAALSPDFGQVFCNIGVYEVQRSASIAFTNFGMAHKYVTTFLHGIHVQINPKTMNKNIGVARYSDIAVMLGYSLQ